MKYLLCQARIHPLEIASNLSKETCATLHKCIKEVGSCVSDLKAHICIILVVIVDFIYCESREIRVGYRVCCSC